MKWYVYYTSEGKQMCECFDQDADRANAFADSVHGIAYMGL